jgi:hypothetical protein
LPSDDGLHDRGRFGGGMAGMGGMGGGFGGGVATMGGMGMSLEQAQASGAAVLNRAAASHGPRV